MNFEKKFEQLLKLIGNTPLIKINYQFVLMCNILINQRFCHLILQL